MKCPNCKDKLIFLTLSDDFYKYIEHGIYGDVEYICYGCNSTFNIKYINLNEKSKKEIII